MEQKLESPKVKYYVEFRFKTYEYERLYETDKIEDAIGYALQTYKHLNIQMQVIVIDSGGITHVNIFKYV